MKRNVSRRCVLWVAVLALAMVLGAFVLVTSAEEATFDYTGFDLVITRVTVADTETVINSDAAITQAVANANANAYAKQNGADKRVAIELGGNIASFQATGDATPLSIQCDLTINLKR